MPQDQSEKETAKSTETFVQIPIVVCCALPIALILGTLVGCGQPSEEELSHRPQITAVQEIGGRELAVFFGISHGNPNRRWPFQSNKHGTPFRSAMADSVGVQPSYKYVVQMMPEGHVEHALRQDIATEFAWERGFGGKIVVLFDNATDEKVSVSIDSQGPYDLAPLSHAKVLATEGLHTLDILGVGSSSYKDSQTVFLTDMDRSRTKMYIACYLYNVAGKNRYTPLTASYR